MMLCNIDALLARAQAVRTHAYAPYSHFSVGAALETENGHCYTGCNVENASFGATICAERAAFAAMVAGGDRQPLALAVCYDEVQLAVPCGLCRQFMYEFNPDLVVFLANTQGQYEQITLRELLPRAFSLER